MLTIAFTPPIVFYRSMGCRDDGFSRHEQPLELLGIGATNLLGQLPCFLYIVLCQPQGGKLRLFQLGAIGRRVAQ